MDEKDKNTMLDKCNEEAKYKRVMEQYKLSIDARDKLTENYYKWMSYYYLANAGVLVAITQFGTKSNNEINSKVLLCLGLVGVFVCLLWHLSCKGYYYWSNSWINIIIRFEKHLFNKNATPTQDQQGEYFIEGVYSVFSEEVINKESQKDFLIPNRSANISTPKLTLFFSWVCIYLWTIYSSYNFYNSFQLPACCKWVIIISSSIFITVLPLILKSEIKSRPADKHIPVK